MGVTLRHEFFNSYVELNFYCVMRINGFEFFSARVLGAVVFLGATWFLSSCSDDDESPAASVAYDVHAVDLGLPSGNAWSDVNYGAASETESGDYYSWGELETKSKFDETTYTSPTADISDGSLAKSENDVIFVKEGGRWYLPTVADWNELRDENYTTWTWEETNSVAGYRITSVKNGNSIFLPAVGYYQGQKLVTAWSIYHTSSADPGYGAVEFTLQFKKGNISRVANYGYLGFPIRAVRGK